MEFTPAQWARVTEVFGEVQHIDPLEREARINELVAGDPVLAEEVLSLLNAADETEGILNGVAIHAVSSMRAQASRLIGQTLGAFTIIREIGRGGMGVVYEGRHAGDEFEQRVAIKTLAIGVQRPELVWRFRRERQILAGLAHPNITTLFDGGTTADGVPYLVMEYVDGQRIDAWAEAHALTIRQRLDLFRTVCDAVQYAHGKLIVHRDLKPGNILVTVDGVVKLLDFGVAKLLTPDDTRLDTTRGGVAPLTTAYASPEQARGEGITTAADIYALGVVLYYLLTGTYPYDVEGKSIAEAISILSTQAPLPPSESVSARHARSSSVPDARALRGALSGELDAIVLMALRKEPTRRYATVQAFSDDVLRYLKGQPVQARPDTYSYRIQKFVARRRALVGGVAIAVLALVGGTAAALRSAASARVESARSQRMVTFLQSVVGAGDDSFFGTIKVAKDITMSAMLDTTVAHVATTFSGDARSRADLYTALGRSYRRFNRYDRALSLFDSGAVLHALALGNNAPEIGSDRLLSAVILMESGKPDSAGVLVRDALRRFASLKNPPFAEQTYAMVALGQLLVLNSNQTDEGMALLRAGLERERRSATPRSQVMSVGGGSLALTMIRRGQTVEGDSLYAATIATLERDPAVSREELAIQLNNWGVSLSDRARFVQAARAKRRGLVLLEGVLGPSHVKTAFLQAILAKDLIQLDSLSASRTLLDSSLTTFDALTSPNPDMLAFALTQRAEYQAKVRDVRGGLASLARARTLVSALRGTRRSEMEVGLLLVEARLRAADGNAKQQRDVLDRAVRIANEKLGTNSPYTKRAISRRAELSAQ
jgi:eukaryotic-like serine/threonine-protein kinase